MKNYRITVNGNEYDVAVEEVGASTSTSAPKAATKGKCRGWFSKGFFTYAR